MFGESKGKTDNRNEEQGMNWYVRLKVAQPVEDDPAELLRAHYPDAPAGFGNRSHSDGAVMWAWINGKLETSTVDYGNNIINHRAVWPNYMHPNPEAIRGRYSPEDNAIIVMSPLAGRPLPTTLVKSLYRTFGDKPIYRY